MFINFAFVVCLGRSGELGAGCGVPTKVAALLFNNLCHPTVYLLVGLLGRLGEVWGLGGSGCGVPKL